MQDSEHIIHHTYHGARRGKLRTYVAGFVLSIVLTLAAYVAVAAHLLAGSALITTILLFAIAQMFVQLVFFLHLGKESGPRWNLQVLLLALLLVVIVVGGSIWIMYNLNYNMMAGGAMQENASLKTQGGGF